MLNPQIFSSVQLVYFSPSQFDLVVSDKLFLRAFFLSMISVESACLWSCVSVNVTVFLLFLSGSKVKPKKTCIQLAVSHFFLLRTLGLSPSPSCSPGGV